MPDEIAVNSEFSKSSLFYNSSSGKNEQPENNRTAIKPRKTNFPLANDLVETYFWVCNGNGSGALLKDKTVERSWTPVAPWKPFVQQPNEAPNNSVMAFQ